jgi:trehalose/maltose transport system substrate-binding protein
MAFATPGVSRWRVRVRLPPISILRIEIPRTKILPMLLLMLCALTGPAHAATISFACGAVGTEFELCRQGAQAWAERTGNTVRMISTPNDANERLALFQQLLAARSPDIDVFQIDVVWPGILAPYLADLAPHVPADEVAGHFPALIENDRIDGRLVALPWFADVGLLYLRRDLLDKYRLPVPQTWAELADTARKIQDAERAAGRPRMWGYVWQGRAYEGLTCNALEWISSSGGGSIVDSNGAVTIDNPRAAQAVALGASFVGKITPGGVLNYTEEEARAVFQAGDAVFMRNWPYALKLANGAESPVAGRVAVAPLPHGRDGKSTGALGGSQLAVSAYSRAPAEAIDLVRWLAGPEEQKRRALAGGFNPTQQRLYEDAELLAAMPQLKELNVVFAGAVARPSAIAGRRYNQVSNEFWNAVHEVLSGRAAAGPALAALAARLRFLSRGEQW